MASFLYDAGRNAFARGDIQWKSGSAQAFKAVLVDQASYTPSQASHANLSDIAAGARVATVAVVPTDPVAGVCDAADITFASVAAGPAAEAIAIYLDTGVEATSTLLAYIDTATGLPVTPNGNNINVTWDNGANKIFKL